MDEIQSILLELSIHQPILLKIKTQMMINDDDDDDDHGDDDDDEFG